MMTITYTDVSSESLHIAFQKFQIIAYLMDEVISPSITIKAGEHQ